MPDELTTFQHSSENLWRVVLLSAAERARKTERPLGEGWVVRYSPAPNGRRELGGRRQEAQLLEDSAHVVVVLVRNDQAVT